MRNKSMNKTEWIILDTETNGLTNPIFVVEIAAQKMLGWEKKGQPFHKMINHNEDIPPEASRVHGYTREILERDGENPHSVYEEFADYVLGTEFRIGSVFLLLVLILVYRRFKLSKKREYLK